MSSVGTSALRTVDIVAFAHGKLLRGGVRSAVPLGQLDATLRDAVAPLADGAVARVDVVLADDHPDPAVRGAPAVLLVRVRRATTPPPLPIEASVLSPEDARAADELALRSGVSVSAADVDAEITARWRRIEEPALVELKLDQALRKEALSLWLTDDAMRAEIALRMRRSLALLSSAPRELRADQVEPFLEELARASHVSLRELKGALKADRALAGAAERILLERLALEQLKANGQRRR